MATDDFQPATKQDISALQQESSALKEEMTKGFADVRAEFEAVRAEIRSQGRAQGKRTRRHFDVVAERIESHVRLVAEVNSHHATILDNHETRLQKIEERR